MREIFKGGATDCERTDEHGNPFGTAYILALPGSAYTYEWVPNSAFMELERQLGNLKEQNAGLVREIGEAQTLLHNQSQAVIAMNTARSEIAKPVLPSNYIAAVIEECALICEARASAWDSAVREGSEQRGYEETVLMECAAQIRKLSTARSATATLMASAQGPAGAATVTASTQGNAAPQGSTTSDQSPGRDPGVVPAVAAPLSRDDKPRESCCTGLPRSLDCKLCPTDPEKASRSSVGANEGETPSTKAIARKWSLKGGGTNTSDASPEAKELYEHAEQLERQLAQWKRLSEQNQAIASEALKQRDASLSATAESDPVKALAAKLNEADAARYRWIRAHTGADTDSYGCYMQFPVLHRKGRKFMQGSVAQHLDEEIDLVMAATPEAYVDGGSRG